MFQKHSGGLNADVPMASAGQRGHWGLDIVLSVICLDSWAAVPPITTVDCDATACRRLFYRHRSVSATGSHASILPGKDAVPETAAAV